MAKTIKFIKIIPVSGVGLRKMGRVPWNLSTRSTMICKILVYMFFFFFVWRIYRLKDYWENMRISLLNWAWWLFCLLN